MASRRFDLVLYGATGFTGTLTAEYLAANAPKTLRWAIAGRSEAKLAEVRAKLGSADSPALIVADGDDPASINDLTQSTRVVLTTVGPFTKYGEVLVAACVNNGTDYVDSTGETPFVADMIAKYGAAAKANGTILVPMSGFDSIPSDLGTFMVVEYARRVLNAKIARVEGTFSITNGVASGGTMASVLEIATPKNLSKLRNPLLLCEPLPDGAPITSRVAAPSDQMGVGYNPDFGYTAPFIMAGANTRVVRRSAALLASSPALSYTSPSVPFSYTENMRVRSWFAGAIVTIFSLIGSLALVFPPTRYLIRKFVKPGQGPSAEARARASFTTSLVGVSEPAAGSQSIKVFGKVSGGEPGYSETAKMLAVSAMILATRRREIPGTALGGGFLTPATAFGVSLIEQLRLAGMVFEVSNVKEDVFPSRIGKKVK